MTAWSHTFPEGISVIWNAVSFRIWTQVTMFTSHNCSHYTTNVSYHYLSWKIFSNFFILWNRFWEVSFVLFCLFSLVELTLCLVNVFAVLCFTIYHGVTQGKPICLGRRFSASILKFGVGFWVLAYFRFSIDVAYYHVI